MPSSREMTCHEAPAARRVATRGSPAPWAFMGRNLGNRAQLTSIESFALLTGQRFNLQLGELPHHCAGLRAMRTA